MGFQENLIHYRKKAGYNSAKEFADKLGVNYTTYMGYENKHREPRYSLLLKIASLLNVSTDTLLGYEPEKPDALQKVLTEMRECGIPLNENEKNGEYTISINGSKFTFDFSKADLLEIHKRVYGSQELKNALRGIYKTNFLGLQFEKYCETLSDKHPFDEDPNPIDPLE